jgi:hypothetical protein
MQIVSEVSLISLQEYVALNLLIGWIRYIRYIFDSKCERHIPLHFQLIFLLEKRYRSTPDIYI